MKNMKVSMKLFVGFLIVGLLAVVISGVSVIQLTRLTDETIDNQQYITLPLDYMVKFAIPYSNVRSSMRDLGRATTQEDNERHATTLETNLAAVNQNISAYYELVSANPNASQEEYDAIKAVNDILVNYTDICLNKLIPYGMANDADGVFATISNDLGPPGTVIRENIDFLTTFNSEKGSQSTARASAELRTSMIINISMLVAVFAAILILARHISGLISKPLKIITDFMKKAGETGDISLRAEDIANIEKLQKIKDEIGELSSGCAGFINHIMNIAHNLETIANGDLTADVEILSDSDVMGKSLQQMLANFNNMFSDISSATEKVSSGSTQLADGAQLLAQGSTEQTATVEELSATITEVNTQTKANAGLANDAKKLGEDIKINAERGNMQMEQMIKAVGEISDASTAIGKVIKIIDDIAFQTNILALNAAVEAARAGQHGKGFAVVADEVRSLAAKSADAAKNTSELIATSIQKSEQGAAISKETAESLSQIVGGIVQSSELVAKIAESSNKQSNSIGQIGEAITHVSQVIQQNSATAEESAAASEEMSGQATMLQSLISQFKLKNQKSAITAARSAPASGNGSTAMAMGAGKY